MTNQPSHHDRSRQTIVVEVSTFDVDFVQTLRADNLSAESPDDCTLRIVHEFERRGLNDSLAHVLELALTFASGVSSQVVASWLYDRLKRAKPEKTTFQISRRRVIELSHDGVARVIEETRHISE
jgi:hypothetical protein